MDLSESVLLDSEESSDYFSGKLDDVVTGNLASLSALGTFLISLTTSDYFSSILDGLRKGTLSYLTTLGTLLISATTSLSTLETFLITGKTLIL